MSNSGRTGDRIGDYVAKRISYIASMGETGQQKAMLANLRRGAGKEPGELPELWGILLDGFPEEWLGNGDGAGCEEWAAYIALTLFALHQQGKSTESSLMHNEGYPLGRALKKLAGGDADKESRVLRRFKQMASSEDIRGVAYHLRGIVQLLKAEDIPLDYKSLARDLHRYQQQEERSRVRLNWAEDFYRMTEEKDEGKEREEVK